MSLFVVDASAGLKWFVPEVHSDAADRLRVPAHELHVPGLFDVELGNVLWKRLRAGELTRVEVDRILAQLPLLPVLRHADAPVVPAAVDIAHRTERSVYDCLYLALAIQLNGKMTTADQRLYNSLVGTPWAAYVLWVEDVP
jgi:predicted nucleic acid-binding protein